MGFLGCCAVGSANQKTDEESERSEKRKEDEL